ncbi:MAG TPA: class I SAM-dependent methyltransferase [Pyrinomonadaceae bacterium]|nr:class I SAM-dependent methyltransferase [Pyrinomonadaceae bacterium]
MSNSNEIQNLKSKIQNRDNAFEKMDAMYRHQRYFYDLTRKYYLLGRDRLIAQMNVQAGENVLEVGFGTGRNLIILAKKYPNTNFWGLDASSEMLKTAQSKIDHENLKNITLEIALADDFDYRKTFNLETPFDTIFFSYSISMIPTWKKSITSALANLKSGGSFHVVDFYDQKEMPAWFRRILKSWLKQFHVEFQSDLLPHLEDSEKQGLGRIKITSIARRYAFIAKFQKTD